MSAEKFSLIISIISICISVYILWFNYFRFDRNIVVEKGIDRNEQTIIKIENMSNKKFKIKKMKINNIQVNIKELDYYIFKIPGYCFKMYEGLLEQYIPVSNKVNFPYVTSNDEQWKIEANKGMSIELDIRIDRIILSKKKIHIVISPNIS